MTDETDELAADSIAVSTASSVKPSTFFAPIDAISAPQQSDDIRIESTVEDLPDYGSAVTEERPLASSSKPKGYPDLDTQSRRGPGHLITCLLGLPGVEGFERGQLGDWTADFWDYEISHVATHPEPKVESSSGSLPRSSSQTSVASVASGPRADERSFRVSRPHPNAFFSPEAHGWSVATPWPPTSLSASPDELQLQGSCPTPADELMQGNGLPPEATAHHFVCQNQKVDPRYILRAGEIPGKERLGLPTGEVWSDVEGVDELVPNGELWPMQRSPNAKLNRKSWWRLYVCSNLDKSHNLAVTTSSEGEIEMVCGRQVALDFEAAKTEHPPLQSQKAGRNEILFTAWELVWKIIDNALIEGERRQLATTGKVFQHKLGWDPETEALFKALGFGTKPTGDTIAVTMPALDDTETGKQDRLVLTRAWIEIGVLVLSLKQRCNKSILKNGSRVETCLTLRDPREQLTAMFGGLNIPKQDRSSAWTTVGKNTKPDILQSYLKLGCTSVDPDAYLIHAFERQRECDIRSAPQYLSALHRIAEDTDSNTLRTAVAVQKSQGCWTLDDERQAYTDIGLDGLSDAEHSVDLGDDIVLAAFSERYEKATDAEQQRKLRDALDLLAHKYDSDVLKTAHESTVDVPAPKMSVEKAFTTLNMPEYLDDNMMLNVYPILVDDAPGRKAVFREALEVIGKHRKSKLIEKFLETGVIGDPMNWEPDPPSADRPVGLENIGNTCYLNSLLQYLFTIKALRDVILGWSDLAETQPFTQDKRVGGRLVTSAEIQRSLRFVEQLAKLFQSLISAPTSAVRPEKDLAYLSLVSAEDERETPVASTSKAAVESSSAMEIDGKSSDNHLLADKSPESGDVTSTTTSTGDDDYVMVEQTAETSGEPISMDPPPMQEVERTATAKEDDGPPPLPPRQPARRQSTKPGTIPASSNMMFGRQHDVGECMDNIMFQIDAALDSAKLKALTGSTSIVQSLMHGKTKQMLDHKATGIERSIKEETFATILVDINTDDRDLYDALDATFEEAIVEAEHGEAVRYLALLEAPPVLQILLQRAQFDKTTARTYKSNAYMPFPQSLCMDRYMEISLNDPAIISKYQQTSDARYELQKLWEETTQLESAELKDIEHQIRSLKDLSKRLDVDESDQDPIFEAMLQEEADHIEAKRKHLKAEIERLKNVTNALWADSAKHEYELSSVFMHRGEASFGHYWLHQRALAKQPDRWIKFNDASITDIDASEVFAETRGQNNNPYLLSYVRKDQINLVDAVCRQLDIPT